MIYWLEEKRAVFSRTEFLEGKTLEKLNFENLIRDSGYLVNSFLDQLDEETGKVMAAALSGGCSLGLHIEILPTPRISLELTEREGSRHEILYLNLKNEVHDVLPH